MGTAGAGVFLLAGLLLAPPDPPSFSPGIGYTVSRLQREADEPVVREEAPTHVASFAPRLPPPQSDLARIQGSRRARGLHVAAAIAAQAAMIVAGILAVREQRATARREQARQVEPYRPYR